jgi:hypothetical protein
MAMPREHLPRLRVIDGGSAAMRREEARVEYLALCQELEVAASRIAVEAKRLVRKAQVAREEIAALTGGDVA